MELNVSFFGSGNNVHDVLATTVTMNMLEPKKGILSIEASERSGKKYRIFLIISSLSVKSPAFHANRSGVNELSLETDSLLSTLEVGEPNEVHELDP